MKRWTGSTTARSTSLSRSNATSRTRLMERAARTRRAGPRSSPAETISRTQRARPPGSRRRPFAPGSTRSARARGPWTCSILRLAELGELGLLRELERLGLASGQDAEGALLGDRRVATLDVLA